MIWRFIALQLLGAAIVIALGLAGYLEGPFNGPARNACIALSAITLIGLGMIALGYRHDAKQIARHLTAVGFLSSVLGLYAQARGLTEANLWSVLGGAFVIWLSTAFGLIGWLWLELTLRVTHVSKVKL